MLYNLDWLQRGKSFPPVAEKSRIERYTQNAALFDGDHFESSDFRHRNTSPGSYISVYQQCARRISRVVNNFEDVICFPVLLNYQRLMTLKMADLVCGEYPNITGASADENKNIKEAREYTDFDSKLYTSVIDISRYGDAIIRIYRDEFGQNTFTTWDPREWYPVVTQDGTNTILKHCLCWLENRRPGETIPDWYLHVQIHGTQPADLGWYEHRVYKMDVGANTILKQISSTIIQTGLKTCAVMHLKAFSVSNSIYGYDDYMPIDSILAEIMSRIGQISVILDKHADPNITGPVSMLTANERTGELELKTGKFFAVSPGEEQPKYMTWEGQLSAAFKQLEMLINQLYILSEMGAALLGSADGGSQAVSGTAMRFKMVNPLAKARRISNSLTRNVRMLFSALNTAIPYEHVSVLWEDGLPDDPRENIETAKLATGATKMMPLEDAIMQFFNKTNAEALTWIDKIREETSENMQLTQQAEGDPNKPGPQDGTGINPTKKGSETGLKSFSGLNNK